jgi:predicted metalloprotease
MSTSRREWIRTFGQAALWFVRAVVWYLAGCAITFMILAVPYLESDEQRQRRANDPDVIFVRRVLADLEDVWDDVFRAAGKQYEKPTLVLFTTETWSACGQVKAIVY